MVILTGLNVDVEELFLDNTPFNRVAEFTKKLPIKPVRALIPSEAIYMQKNKNDKYLTIIGREGKRPTKHTLLENGQLVHLVSIKKMHRSIIQD